MKVFSAILVAFALVTSSSSQDSHSEAEIIDEDSGQVQLNVEHSLDEGATSITQNPLSDSEHEALLSLCDQQGLYLLKLTSSSKKAPAVHRAVTDACNLVSSGLKDELTVHLDWKSQIVGVSITAAQQGARRNNATGLESGTPSGFKTKVTVQTMEAGPQPDTAAFIQKMEQEKLAKQRGETKDNRSFFAKYWMYIVPVVLVLAMSSANPEGQAGGR